jgi:hypothetical protein
MNKRTQMTSKHWILLFIISFFLVGCEKENKISDLNPCNEENKLQFYFVKKLDLLKNYQLSKPVSTKKYMVFYGSGNTIDQPVWVVLNLDENNVNTYDASRLATQQKMSADMLYFIDSFYYISYLNVKEGTTNRVPVNPDKSSGKIKHFQIFENYVYALFYLDNTKETSVIRFNIDTGIAETIFSINNIRNKEINAFDNMYIRPYINTQGDLCLLLLARIHDSHNSYVAYSNNITNENEEYYRVLGKDIFYHSLESDINQDSPFFRFTHSSAEYFNFIENKIYVYPENSQYQFPYVITKKGEIYHLLTKQLIQTFSPPLASYAIRYFDAKKNSLFLNVNNQFAILDLNSNCFTAKIPNQFQNQMYVIDELKRLAWVIYEGGNTNIQMYDVK